MYTEFNIHTGQSWRRDLATTSMRLTALGYNAEALINEMDAGNEVELEHAWFRGGTR